MESQTEKRTKENVPILLSSIVRTKYDGEVLVVYFRKAGKIVSQRIPGDPETLKLIKDAIPLKEEPQSARKRSTFPDRLFAFGEAAVIAALLVAALVFFRASL